jgi:hypothetical protein
MKTFLLPSLRNLGLILVLLLFVWAVNLPLIHFDMMYPEQPLIYLANQKIHSWTDLLAVYIHPKMFHLSILFFRPSGHFLLYQLLTPFLGWHNTQALIMVNLGFLALSGFLLIKLYELLFPSFKVGGYLAFSLYLMHPTLMLSRLIVLHFEFAHIFFVLLSLYCFVYFCQQNFKETQKQRAFFLSLFFFAFAVTFKEPALMLGPVLLSYFCLSLYAGEKPSHFLGRLMQQKTSREPFIMIFLLTALLTLYLSLQWPTLAHPLRADLKSGAFSEAARKLFLLLVGFKTENLFSPPVWRNVSFPLITQGLMGFFVIISMLATSLLFLRSSEEKIYKKSLLFLYGAAFLFLLLPLSWAWGLPWHWGLSLLFLSLLMGFSAEYLGSLVSSNKRLMKLGLLFLALLIGLTTLLVDFTNLRYISEREGYALTVGHNAVFAAPPLSSLQNDSVLVVEDSVVQDSYLLGASIYPYAHTESNKPQFKENKEAEWLLQEGLLLKQQPIYNGSLFRWAYLKPGLQEEVYPFQIGHMDKVPSVVLYNWLRENKKIVCLGYDEQGLWHDKTPIFKQKLLEEQRRRRLELHNYDLMPGMAVEGNLVHSLTLSFPAPEFCQLECDQNSQCTGFTYFNTTYQTATVSKCYFYEGTLSQSQKFCPNCLGFYKIDRLS